MLQGILKALHGDTSLMLVIAIGAVGLAVGLGCLIVGLVDDWREWAATHLPGRRRD